MPRLDQSKHNKQSSKTSYHSNNSSNTQTHSDAFVEDCDQKENFWEQLHQLNSQIQLLQGQEAIKDFFEALKTDFGTMFLNFLKTNGIKIDSLDKQDYEFALKKCKQFCKCIENETLRFGVLFQAYDLTSLLNATDVQLQKWQQWLENLLATFQATEKKIKALFNQSEIKNFLKNIENTTAHEAYKALLELENVSIGSCHSMADYKKAQQTLESIHSNLNCDPLRQLVLKGQYTLDEMLSCTHDHRTQLEAEAAKIAKQTPSKSKLTDSHVNSTDYKQQNFFTLQTQQYTILYTSSLPRKYSTL